MRRLAVGALIVSLAACSAMGQSVLAFEVASVKAAPPPTGNGISVHMSQDAARINYSNVSMSSLLANAFTVRERLITGPEWLKTQRFDVVAKLPVGATKDQVPQMLQTLLADRFGLAVHKESTIVPIYALTVGKNGCKMPTAESDEGMGISNGPKGAKMNGKTTMDNLARNLSGMLDRPVVDMTGLKGIFEIVLVWSSDDAAKMGPAGGSEAKTIFDSADGASVFTAIQEKLGLKLEPRKGPVEFIVVDHVEKTPTEN